MATRKKTNDLDALKVAKNWHGDQAEKHLEYLEGIYNLNEAKTEFVGMHVPFLTLSDKKKDYTMTDIRPIRRGRNEAERTDILRSFQRGRKIHLLTVAEYKSLLSGVTFSSATFGIADQFKIKEMQKEIDRLKTEKSLNTPK